MIKFNNFHPLYAVKAEKNFKLYIYQQPSCRPGRGGYLFLSLTLTRRTYLMLTMDVMRKQCCR